MQVSKQVQKKYKRFAEDLQMRRFPNYKCFKTAKKSKKGKDAMRNVNTCE